MKSNGKQTQRRPIEREYLATLNAAVPLESWQAICKRADDDALAGDAKARGRRLRTIARNGSTSASSTSCSAGSRAPAYRYLFGNT